uniref:Uncharacterized protein n=1 Tax=Hyaloperonospora arabidopsidis (strain Emoy2) TaxID=559515 RepID=M4BWF4_HYAAE
MHSRATRAVSEVVVAAGTAGAIASAWWLLNQLLTADDRLKRTSTSSAYLDSEAVASPNTSYPSTPTRSYQPERDRDIDDGFTSLPVVSVSESDTDEDAMDYTAEYYTPHHDVCMLSVSVQTLLNPLANASTDRTSDDCRLCEAEADENGTASMLSFSDTESSSSGSALSLSNGYNEREENWIVPCSTHSRTEQWLYIRL